MLGVPVAHLLLEGLARSHPTSCSDNESHLPTPLPSPQAGSTRGGASRASHALPSSRPMRRAFLTTARWEGYKRERLIWSGLVADGRNCHGRKGIAVGSRCPSKWTTRSAQTPSKSHLRLAHIEASLASRSARPVKKSSSACFGACSAPRRLSPRVPPAAIECPPPDLRVRANYPTPVLPPSSHIPQTPPPT